MVGNLSSLLVLKLSNNNFHGEIFSEHFSLFNESLRVLELNDNHFTGTFSSKIQPSFWLTFLDLSNNFFSGKIPRWQEFNFVWSIDMSNNFFEGQIPCQLRVEDLIDLIKVGFQDR